MISKSVAHNRVRVVVSNLFHVSQQYDVFLKIHKCAIEPEMKGDGPVPSCTAQSIARELCSNLGVRLASGNEQSGSSRGRNSDQYVGYRHM